jgi:hypothetical protein
VLPNLPSFISKACSGFDVIPANWIDFG